MLDMLKGDWVLIMNRDHGEPVELINRLDGSRRKGIFGGRDKRGDLLVFCGRPDGAFDRLCFADQDWDFKHRGYVTGLFDINFL